ncbi:hypothetical protein H4R18_001269 [Coemansia javaensis]|uniref:N-acetyltransferase domain-containing protein n=1 Tax=Coemansia javaensis TaxID=2761396 RepID=A0A9W8HEB6_9FUNG|nr:hypothetical protein H4R18_001269 [Coemansia javaensis]
MAKKFKYSLEALEWDEEHTRNKEAQYCYCGMDYNSGDAMLRCDECRQLFHWDCVSCLKGKPLLGDTFYRFRCAEEYERDVLSWVQVIYIVLYHLIQQEPERSYFRWRENICATIGERWEYLFSGKAKTATWHNTVAGCLSTHTALFKSGFEDTRQTGNWTLQKVVEPAKAHFKAATRGGRDGAGGAAAGAAAAQGAAKRERTKRKQTDTEREILDALNEGGRGAGAARRGARHHRVSFSDDEDDQGGAPRRPRAKRRRPELRGLANDAELLQSLEVYTQLERQRLGGAPVAAAATTAAAAPPDNSDEEVLETGNARDPGSLDVDVFDECSSLSSWASGDSGDLDAMAAEAGTGTTSSADRPARASLSGAARADGDGVQTALRGVEPCAMAAAVAGEAAAAVLMGEREQWAVGVRLGLSGAAMAAAPGRRLHRRLQLRRLKRVLGLRPLDIDEAVRRYMRHPQRPWWAAGAAGTEHPNGPGPAGNPEQCGDPEQASGPGLGSGSGPASGAERAGDHEQLGAPDTAAATPYAHSFASRLLGRAALRDSLTLAGARVSPFHGRRLRPFIWRDFWPAADCSGGGGGARATTALPMLRTLRAIRGRQHALLQARGLGAAPAPERDAIDYVHFQAGHVRQVNALLCRTFWPGIDVSEALQYPEFSVVALYRRRVVGCAFLTPDAYLTYIAVAAGWEGAGMARFMLFHLTQTVPTKDVTLHVSAENTAMVLYQQLGFKPETYVTGFYRDYLPAGSRACPHAFFMRLRRY